jgi:uncharacterized protein (DUF58 family)
MRIRSVLSAWISQKSHRWLLKRIPAGKTASLGRKNIFILPTSAGLLYLLASTLIFVTAINYVLSLAFALAFLMISIFILSILHTFHNLQHLRLQGIGATPVFAGEDALFTVLLVREPTRVHEMLELGFAGGPLAHAKLIEPAEIRANVLLPTSKRGLQRAPRLLVQTRFPLGLWRAWSTIDLAMETLVYPKPIALMRLPGQVNHRSSTNVEGSKAGAEDFQGLRNYQTGDSPKQIAWKTLARGQGLQVKQFVDNADDRCMLNWEMFTGFDDEARLSGLCYWVLQLSAANVEFGLCLPGVEIVPGKGEVHRGRALSALALWGATAIDAPAEPVWRRVN